jgi:site-specific DNA-methyltransferase (adenine-specific)
MILHGDSLTMIPKLRKEQFDLVFADPPFNIGYQYDRYHDRLPASDYVTWTRRWLVECKRVLKPTGTIWVAIGDDYAAQVKIAIDELGFTMRNWVIWHYTFGVQCSKKYARAHTHLLYFVADKKRFTFNADAIRVPSARQQVYGDKRANPLGKIPDDVWTFSRICGTFKERTGHPCQMPEAVLERIIKTCTCPGDKILDPFAGSGTTLAVARKLGRKCVGIELSQVYCDQIQNRLKGVR